MFEHIAPILAYDAAVLGDYRSVPLKTAAAFSVPALVMNGTVLPLMLDTASHWQMRCRMLSSARRRASRTT
jgi:hypothetical protein